MRHCTNRPVAPARAGRPLQPFAVALLLGLAGLMATRCPAQAAGSDEESASAAPARVQAQIATLRKEYGRIEEKLYEMRRKYERSDAVAALRAAARKASEDYEAARDTDEATLAARKAQREISAALNVLIQKKIETNPEGLALRQKIKELADRAAELRYAHAVAELKLTHRDSFVGRSLEKDATVARLRTAYYKAKGKARDEARDAYYAARKAALARIPDAQALTAEMATAIKGAKEAETAGRAAERELAEVKKRIEADKDAREIAALRAKYDAARQAERDAENGAAIKAARDARSAAYRAASAKVKELLAEDAVAAELEEKYRQLRKGISALEREARELRKRAGPSSKKR